MKTILVIEDFSSIRQLICNKLQSKGYRTIPAATSREAYDVLSKPSSKVNLVLSDFNLPDTPGFDLLKNIKSNPAMENIPVVFLTSEFLSDKIQIAHQTGMANFVQKPFRDADFFNAIKRAIKTAGSLVNVAN